MQHTTDELDSYLKMKYGYPLTADSYDKMSDDLIISLYKARNIHIGKSDIEDPKNARTKVSYSFKYAKIFNKESWFASDSAWKVIKEYYRQQWTK